MSAGYLLDTNVLSETRKIRPNPGVVTFIESTDEAGLFVSVLTLGELRKGVQVKLRSDIKVAEKLRAWVDEIETTFSGRLLPVDAAIARLWGEMTAEKNLPTIDALLAATALERELILVTRNTRDVRLAGVQVVNPWE